MATARLQNVIRHLGLAVAARNSAGVPDARLLERFLSQRDEAAFELLVWRHGKMVLGTCRRLLQDVHEAEDAFQACFLALARRASSISRRESVGGWLHKVAYRLALGAKARRAKRATREQPLSDPMPAAEAADPASEAARRETWRVLDDEVGRLPDKYRVPFVLCCLEGRSNADAARELGCPLGTVESRLTRARQRLRAGLSRRGVAPTAGLLAALPVPDATAFVPAALVSSTAKAAALAAAGSTATAGLLSAEVTAMTEGVLRAMLMTKLKATAVVLLAVALAGTGTGVVTYHSAVADQPGPTAVAPSGQTPAANDAERIAKLIGQLGSDVFAERQKATTELEEIGVPALDALRRAARGDDPERKKRAEDIVKRIEARLESARILAPKRVQLVFRNIPVAQAVADFRKVIGYDIALDDPEGKLKDRTVTLDTGDVTFWRALDLFCQAAGAVEAPPAEVPPLQLPMGGGGGGGARAGGGGGGRGAGGGAGPGMGPIGTGSVTWPFDLAPPQARSRQILLSDGRVPMLPSDDRSAVRVRAMAVAPAAAGAGEILMLLEAAAEPRLRWQQTLAVRVGKATDDQGRNLEHITTADEAPALPRAGVAVGANAGGMGRSIRVEGGGPDTPARASLPPIRLKSSGPAVKSLTEVSGVITALVAEDARPLLTVDEVLKSGGRTVKGADGGSITILEVTRQPNGEVTIRFEVDPPAGVLPADGSLVLSRRGRRVVMSRSGAAAADTVNLEMAVVNDRDQLLQPVGLEYRLFAAKGPEYALTLQSGVGQGEPAKLVLSLNKSVTIDVPFTLKNVPLP